MAATKVALLASTSEHRQHLQSVLEQNGLKVVINEPASTEYLKKLKKSKADVLLVNINDNDEDDELVDAITGNTELPILFNDGSTEGVNIGNSSEAWTKKLADKLVGLASGAQEALQQWEAPHPMAKISGQAIPHAAVPILKKPTDSDEIDFDIDIRLPEERQAANAAALSESNLNVWVLGASLGGPQAVRQFLAAIKEDLPVTFILAQHIGANHVTLLAEQLNRVTKFSVLPGRTGHKISHREVILTPADKQLTFTDDGYIALKPAPPSAVYSPSIDNVMIEVAKRFGGKSGTIVFSGMGDDGAKGCEDVAKQGGIVWAQDIASCVVSSMPDHARKTGTVSYSANPEQLAQHLYEHFKQS